MDVMVKNSAIEIRGIIKNFGTLQAVKGVNLDIDEGVFLGLLGPNGAGKTTLIEMIEGIQQPDSGEIKVFGRDIKGAGSALRSLMGIALQETRFIDKITVLETLKLFASFYSAGAASVREVISLTGLSEKSSSYVMNLSGGQKQKLALGIALINSPKILLLDEPTTGLDPGARREIWSMLEGLRRSGTTMILTTHYMEEAEVLCERIVIMHRGEFIADGSLDRLQEIAGNSDVIEFTVKGVCGDDIFEKVPGVKNISWNCETGSGRMLVTDNVEALPEFMLAVRASGAVLEKFESHRVSLDDLFVSLTGERLDS
jgi:ABC-2 type transport system ATP-binding protein